MHHWRAFLLSWTLGTAACAGDETGAPPKASDREPGAGSELFAPASGPPLERLGPPPPQTSGAVPHPRPRALIGLRCKASTDCRRADLPLCDAVSHLCVTSQYVAERDAALERLRREGPPAPPAPDDRVTYRRREPDPFAYQPSEARAPRVIHPPDPFAGGRR